MALWAGVLTLHALAVAVSPLLAPSATVPGRDGALPLATEVVPRPLDLLAAPSSPGGLHVWRFEGLDPWRIEAREHEPIGDRRVFHLIYTRPDDDPFDHELPEWLVMDEQGFALLAEPGTFRAGPPAFGEWPRWFPWSPSEWSDVRLQFVPAGEDLVVCAALPYAPWEQREARASVRGVRSAPFDVSLCVSRAGIVGIDIWQIPWSHRDEPSWREDLARAARSPAPSRVR